MLEKILQSQLREHLIDAVSILEEINKTQKIDASGTSIKIGDMGVLVSKLADDHWHIEVTYIP